MHEPRNDRGKEYSNVDKKEADKYNPARPDGTKVNQHQAKFKRHQQHLLLLEMQIKQ